MKQERVQSIYGKGFDDGFKAAKEELKREGWRKVTARDDLSIGDIVRPVVRTIFGVKWPESKVIGFNGNTVQCLRLTHWKSLDRWEDPSN